jgi:DNA-binding transcriptional regulator YiaG
MLTYAQFDAWIKQRVKAGESMSAVGRSMGVSHEAVRQWANGSSHPSRMALVLAGHLSWQPVDLADGLPSPDADRAV